VPPSRARASEAAKFWGKNWFDTAEDGVMEAAKKGNYQINKYVISSAGTGSVDQGGG